MNLPPARKISKPRSKTCTHASESVVVLSRSVIDALRAKLRAEKAGAA